MTRTSRLASLEAGKITPFNRSGNKATKFLTLSQRNDSEIKKLLNVGELLGVCSEIPTQEQLQQELDQIHNKNSYRAGSLGFGVGRLGSKVLRNNNPKKREKSLASAISSNHDIAQVEVANDPGIIKFGERLVDQIIALTRLKEPRLIELKKREIESLSEIIKEDPTEVNYAKREKLYDELGDYEAAKNDFAAILKIRGDDLLKERCANLTFTKGDVDLATRMKSAEVVMDTSKIIDLRPDFFTYAENSRSIASDCLKNYHREVVEEILQDVNKRLEEDSNLYDYLLRMSINLSLEKPKEASDDFESALNLRFGHNPEINNLNWQPSESDYYFMETLGLLSLLQESEKNALLAVKSSADDTLNTKKSDLVFIEKIRLGSIEHNFVLKRSTVESIKNQIEDLNKKIEENPSVQSYLMREKLHNYLGNQEDARKDLNSILELEPDFLNNRIQALKVFIGDMDQENNFLREKHIHRLHSFSRTIIVARHLDVIIDLDPSLKWVHHERGAFYHKLGLMSDVIDKKEKIFGVFRRRSEPRYIENTNREFFKKALQDFDQEVAINPNNYSESFLTNYPKDETADNSWLNLGTILGATTALILTLIRELYLQRDREEVARRERIARRNTSYREEIALRYYPDPVVEGIAKNHAITLIGIEMSYENLSKEEKEALLAIDFQKAEKIFAEIFNSEPKSPDQIEDFLKGVITESVIIQEETAKDLRGLLESIFKINNTKTITREIRQLTNLDGRITNYDVPNSFLHNTIRRNAHLRSNNPTTYKIDMGEYNKAVNIFNKEAIRYCQEIHEQVHDEKIKTDVTELLREMIAKVELSFTENLEQIREEKAPSSSPRIAQKKESISNLGGKAENKNAR